MCKLCEDGQPQALRRPRPCSSRARFSSLSQQDTGVTTVLDVSQIHHSPAHGDASIQALRASERRAVFGYFESAGGVAGNQYPGDTKRIKAEHSSSSDQLLSMFKGGEVYLPGHDLTWQKARDTVAGLSLSVPIEMTRRHDTPPLQKALNVALLNHVPGAMMSLMDRSNVESVMVTGKLRKWKGQLLDANIGGLRRVLVALRDHLFASAGVERDLFRAP